MRYGWELARVPSHCVCGASFSVDHAMICCHGDLTFICHNELRDLTASWLHEVCHDVAVEPCHTTNGPPTIGPPGSSAATMDGPPDHARLLHLVQGDYLRHLASPQLVPHSHGRSPTARPFHLHGSVLQ